MSLMHLFFQYKINLFSWLMFRILLNHIFYERFRKSISSQEPVEINFEIIFWEQIIGFMLCLLEWANNGWKENEENTKLEIRCYKRWKIRSEKTKLQISSWRQRSNHQMNLWVVIALVCKRCCVTQVWRWREKVPCILSQLQR